MSFIGELCALSAALLWAGSALIFASVSARIGSVQANINRMVVAIFFLIVSLYFLNIPIRLSPTQALHLAFSAVVGIVFGDTFLFKAFQQIGARISMLIMSLAPAIGAILAYIFLREVLSLWAIIGMIVTLGGIAIVVLEREPSIPSHHPATKIGILFAFLGALGQGGGVVLAKKAFAEGPIHGFVATLIRLSVALLVLLPVAIITRRYHNPVKIFAQDRKILVQLLLGGFFGTYLGITLSLIAVAHTKVGIASTLIATSPVLMLPMVKLIYKEVLSWKAIAGAFIAVAGVAMLFLV